MTTAELLSVLEHKGVKLWEESGNLRYSAPKGTMNGELLQEIASRKQEVLGLLKESGEAESIATAPESEHIAFPLTDLQAAYLIGRASAYEMGNIACHVYLEFDKDDLSPELLSRGWNRLIRRHGMLRAVILPDGTQQILRETPEYVIPVTALATLPDDERRQELQDIRHSMSHQIFRADLWPLFELRVSTLPEGKCRIHFSIDQLIADGYSLEVLFRELALLCREPDAPLPPISLSFRDYVLAENKLEGTPEYERARQYWSQRLENMPPAPALPLAKAPESVTVPRFSCRSMTLEPAAWGRLKSRAAKAGVTPTGAVLAAYTSVLALWSRSQRFTINMTAFNRLPLHPEVMDIVGEFTSVNLLSVDHTSRETFEMRARAVQQQLWETMDNRSYNGIQVMRELARRRGQGGEAAMPVVFTSTIGVGPTGQDAFDLGKFGTVAYHISQTPQVWLDNQIVEVDGALICNWDAVEELFPEGMLNAMFDALKALLHSLADREEAWSGPMPLKKQEPFPEKRETFELPLSFSETTLDVLFKAAAATSPNSAALIAPDRTLSYAELESYAIHIGNLLRGQVEKGALVAVIMPKGWEQAAAILGILYAGAAYLPIDPELPRERMELLLRDGNSSVVLTTSTFAEKLMWPGGSTIISVDTLEVETREAGQITEPSHVTPDALAYVIHTSGSTGVPKGVAMTHRAVINTILDINKRFGVTAEDRIFALSALNFDLSVYDLFGAFAAGAALVLPGPDEGRDAAAWRKRMASGKVTVWNSVPALMQMLLASPEEPGTVDPVASLRLVMLSGDWIPLDLPGAIREKAPAASVISLGGATEAAIWSICYPIDTVRPEWKSIPYGRALANQEMHVLNSAMEPCPAWVPGELYISGTGLAAGYWNDEKRTREAFITHPVTGQRLYRTGDWARFLPDGLIEFLGREDSQVKIRGHRIELGEIETTLKAHPAVLDAVVTVSRDESGSDRLAAHVVAKPGAADSKDQYTQCISWRELLKAGRKRARLLPGGASDIPAFLDFCDTLDQLSIAYMCRTLHAFDAFTKAGRLSADEILARNGILAEHRKLLVRWLLALSREGLLHDEGNDVFSATEALPLDPVDDLWKSLRSAGDLVGDTAILIRFMERSYDNLVSMFTGKKEPQKLLFPEGEMDVAESVYQTNPMSAYFHNILQGLAAACAAGEGSLRILEVGAGVGSSSTAVLPALNADKTLYHFTDISSFFLKAAKEKFSQYPFISYGLFDINTPHEEQGYEAHSFDVIIANNVLHNAVNISTTLTYLHSLLDTGGCVFILDQTSDYLPLMTTLEFLIDFGEYDDERKEHKTPFFSREQWLAALSATGFGRQTAFPRAGHPYGAVGQHCLVGQSTDAVNALRPSLLLEYLADKLPRYMIPARLRFIDNIPLTATGKVDRKKLAAIAKPSVAVTEKAFIPPRTEEEKSFAKIWRELLGVDKIGLNDNFFELGGDSLLLTKLLAKMREMYGNDVDWEGVSFRSLFEAPTIEGMLALLRVHAMTPVKQEAAQAPAFAPQPTTPREGGQARFSLPGKELEYLVPLRPSGSLTPFFLACDARNTTFIYRNLAEGHEPERPVFALRLKPGAGYAETDITIEDIASRYLKDIRTVQPVGPYLLGGFCMGGIIAYEMARQLAASGDEAALVALISSTRSHFLVDDDTMVCFMLCTELEIPLEELGLQIDPGILSEVSNSLLAWYNAGKSAGHWKDALDATRHEGFLRPYNTLSSLSRRERLERIHELARKRRHPYLENLSLNDFEDMFTLYKAGVAAVSRYRPQQYDKPLLLLRPKRINPLIAQLVDSAALWKSVGQNALEVMDVDGGHESCLEIPHVHGLTAKLDLHLRRAVGEDRLKTA